MEPSLAMSLALVMVAAGGCVAQSKYQEAVAEADTVKTDLERTKAQTAALEEQVKSTTDQSAKLKADTELASAELKRLQESRDQDRERVEKQLRGLERELNDLTSQHKTLRRQTEALEKENGSLKSTVARYQKELKDHAQAAAPPSPPPSKPGEAAGALSSPSRSLAGKSSDTKEAQQTGIKPSLTQPSTTTPGSPASKPQVAKTDSKPVVEPLPAEEESGLLAMILRWLSKLWHMLF
jgi:myosin heavy subunit